MFVTITGLVLTVFIVLEIVSAPIEWLWPAYLGGNTHWQGAKSEKILSLTFDDGPSTYTPEVLDLLKIYNARATFFVMGQEVERYPEVIKRMSEEGHEVGNHTYNLKAQKNIFFSDINVQDIKRTQNIIEKYSGQRPKYYRSPGAQMGRKLFNAVKNESLKVVYTAVMMPHPKHTAKKQYKTALKGIQPGAIIILHDGDDQNPNSDRPKSTLELLPELLKEITRQGYKIVTVSELLATKSD